MIVLIGKIPVVSVDVGFQDVFSNDPQILDVVIPRIHRVWELSFGNGTMRKPCLDRT